jgi:hypothetical protein
VVALASLLTDPSAFKLTFPLAIILEPLSIIALDVVAVLAKANEAPDSLALAGTNEPKVLANTLAPTNAVVFTFYPTLPLRFGSL